MAPQKQKKETPKAPEGPFDYHQFYCEENVYRQLAKIKVMQNLHKLTGNNPMKGWTCEASYALVISSFHCPVENAPARSWPNSMLPIAIQALAVDDTLKSAMVWDYHVISALQMQPLPTEEDKAPKATWWIFDQDTKIEAPEGSPFGKFCIPMEQYFQFSFFEWKDGRAVPEPHTAEEFTEHTAERLRIRAVPADDFIAGLSSDRSHMMNLMQPKNAAGNVNWMAPPPSWPLIQKQTGVAMNLAWYINMTNTEAAHKTEKGKKEAPAGTVHHVQDLCAYLVQKHQK